MKILLIAILFITGCAAKTPMEIIKSTTLTCYSGGNAWMSLSGPPENFSRVGSYVKVQDDFKRNILTASGNCLLRTWYADEVAAQDRNRQRARAAAQKKKAESQSKKKKKAKKKK